MAVFHCAGDAYLSARDLIGGGAHGDLRGGSVHGHFHVRIRRDFIIGGVSGGERRVERTSFCGLRGPAGPSRVPATVVLSLGLAALPPVRALSVSVWQHSIAAATGTATVGVPWQR